MKLEFDLARVRKDTTDFFVGVGRGKTPAISFVRTDQSIREALAAAVGTTWTAMQSERDQPEPYDPSNDYRPTDALYIPLDDPMASKARYIREAVSAQTPDELTNALEMLPKSSLYATRMYDEDGQALVAVKNVSGLGRRVKKGILARLAGNQLHLVEDPEFQLSEDFDFLIDAQKILVYRPTSCESACNLHQMIREAAQANVEHITRELSYVDFGTVASGQTWSIREARELAAIKAHGFSRNLDRRRLMEYCDEFGIGHSSQNGKICIEPGHGMRFLQLLARKILAIQLSTEGPEVYLVSSRKALAKQPR